MTILTFGGILAPKQDSNNFLDFIHTINILNSYEIPYRFKNGLAHGEPTKLYIIFDDEAAFTAYLLIKE